jgi:DNA mismatch repair ATPase MutS
MPSLPHRCLFATHYHGLCQESELVSCCAVAHMASTVDSEGLVPLYSLRKGPAPEVRATATSSPKATLTCTKPFS